MHKRIVVYDRPMPMPSAHTFDRLDGFYGVDAVRGNDSVQFDLGARIGTIGGMIMALQNHRGRKLISCRQAAETYGCTMRYIRRLAKDGKLETELVGGSYLFDEAAVKALAALAGKAEGRERKRSEGFKPG